MHFFVNVKCILTILTEWYYIDNVKYIYKTRYCMLWLLIIWSKYYTICSYSRVCVKLTLIIFSSAARGIIILYPTLGLSWAFSVIAANHDAMIWKYLFAIATSTQVRHVKNHYNVETNAYRCHLKVIEIIFWINIKPS
jgi:hypothetical protein